MIFTPGKATWASRRSPEKTAAGGGGGGGGVGAGVGVGTGAVPDPAATMAAGDRFHGEYSSPAAPLASVTTGVARTDRAVLTLAGDRVGAIDRMSAATPAA